MKALICVLIFSSVIRILLSSFCCEQMEPPGILTSIADNREKIERIFRKVSTLNILLKSYDQPEGILQSLGEIFKLGELSFVVFNFESEVARREWKKNCQEFKDDPELKTTYYEMFYQKSRKKILDSKYNHFEADSMDPQVSPAHQPSEAVRSVSDSFANILDSWSSFRKGGFILFCSFEELSLFLGCLMNRSGTFLFIINSVEDNRTLQELCVILNTSWKSSTNLKLFVLIFNEIYSLNPFEIDKATQTFGILETFSGKDEIKKHSFRNLNRYPMNVDMFYSAYSVTRGENFTGKLNTFRGPDVKVAEFIEEQMNISGN